MAEHRATGGGPDLLRAARSLSLAPAALAPAISDPAYRVLIGDDDSAVLLRRQWTPDGIAEAVLLASTGVDPETPAVLATAAAWGCDRVRGPGGRGVLAVEPPPSDASVEQQFLHFAALAATRVETAVAMARGTGEDRIKADGSPSVAADEAAHVAAEDVLRVLGVALLSEERIDRKVGAGESWIVLDPLDGTGSPSRHAVVLSAHHRRPEDRSTTTPDHAVSVPSIARRVRVTGCTAVELCLVADGSAAAWHDIDRSGAHVHDIAGGLAVLHAAGGAALTPEGEPLRLYPDTEAKIRFVAASSPEAAAELLAAVS